MLNPSHIIELFGRVAIIAPILVSPLILVSLLFAAEAKEKILRSAVFTALLTSTTCLLIALTLIVLAKIGGVTLDAHPHLELENHILKFSFILDGLGLCFALPTLILVSISAYFSGRYLHRDTGILRFFALLLLFTEGMLWIFLGGNLSTLYAGWEIVGLTSCLLIAFHYTRNETVRHALVAFWNYRIADSALIGSILLVSHLKGVSDFVPHELGILLFNGSPESHSNLLDLTWALLLIAALAKSAQTPFSSWLPKAMEGPTPSSAIFYGGLAVHLGIFLLLRISGELEAVWWFSPICVVSGLVTAITAALTGETQSDVKSSLAYASVTQVGLMFIELGLGLHQVVIVHFIGHAFFRMYQILNAASVLHNWRQSMDLESRVMPPRPQLEQLLPKTVRTYVYSGLLVFAADDSHPRLLTLLTKFGSRIEKKLFALSKSLLWKQIRLVGSPLTGRGFLTLVVSALILLSIGQEVDSNNSLYQILVFLFSSGLVLVSLTLLVEKNLDRAQTKIAIFQLLQLALIGLLFPNDVPLLIVQGGNSLVGLLMIAISLGPIRARYGTNTSSRGFAEGYPYLSCVSLFGVLSLSAFPGTIGFFAEDLTLLESMDNHWAVVGMICISLGLFGFSTFQAYSGYFLGRSNKTFHPSLRLTVKEKVVITIASSTTAVLCSIPFFLTLKK